MSALILQYLPFLFQAANSIPQIYEYIMKVKASLQQQNQWTPEMDAAFTKELEDLKANPPNWWKTDAQQV